jgi:hypothetical protein
MSSKRFISLTDDERDYLHFVKKSSSLERERDRSHGLLLSSEGYSMDMISSIFKISRDTVTSWFNRWDSLKIDGGISDAPKSGRPRIFTASEEKKL